MSSLVHDHPTVTRADYDRVFTKECQHSYPIIDAFEARRGYALATARLLEAAQILACPFKIHPPNWQHGRVLYALTRSVLEGQRGPVRLLDIGTAKGFSALCLQWALTDAGTAGTVISVDVIDPIARCRRNTVVEIDGYQTLSEILAPWPEASAIHFLQSTGVDWLHRYQGRIELAFVDGKHDGTVVWKEALLLADRQQSGDVILFDDVHLPAIRRAVESLHAYTVELVPLLPQRAYAIARRR